MQATERNDVWGTGMQIDGQHQHRRSSDDHDDALRDLIREAVREAQQRQTRQK